MLKMRIETPRLDPLVAALVFQLRNKKAFVKNWANSVAIEARGNAREKGGRRYWQELARSIRVKSISATEAEISSDYKGAVIKQYGGEIRPVNAKALTVPISPEAKGRTAYEIERTGKKLFVISQKTGDPGTVGVLGYARTRKSGDSDFRPLFVLRTRVMQKPDPWFPDAMRIMALAGREAEILLAKERKNWNTH